MTRLIVENVHRIPSRPWAFVTGRLEGGELRMGDELVVRHGDVPEVAAVVRSIEVHSAPGTTTVALDAELAVSLRRGTVLSRADTMGHP